MKTSTALVLLCSACSPAAFYPAHPSTVHQLDALRSDNGACADQWLEQHTNIRACAQTGSPNTLSDSNTPLLVTHLSGPSFPDADPSNWLVIVTGPDGKELLRQRGSEKVGKVGYCSEYGCNKWNIDTQAMPAAWQPGTYRIRYVCAFNTRRVVDLSITLGAAPPVRQATATQ